MSPRRAAIPRPSIQRRPPPQPSVPIPMKPNDPPRPARQREPHPEHPECIVGETLCRVRILTEQQWDALPPNRRPRAAEHYPGLGWVVAIAGRDD
jgi:hypothetical protein